MTSTVAMMGGKMLIKKVAKESATVNLDFGRVA